MKGPVGICLSTVPCYVHLASSVQLGLRESLSESAVQISQVRHEGCVLLDGTVRLSRPRPVSGANHIAPTRLADGKASLNPLCSVFQFSSATSF